MAIRMTQARRRKIGTERIRFVTENNTREFRVSGTGDTILWWVGQDSTGIDLEVGAIEVQDRRGQWLTLIIHVMPTRWRRRGR